MQQPQMQQCETMTTCSASSSFESSSTLSDLSENNTDPDIFIHSTTPMIWWPETDSKAKPKLTKRAKHCEMPSMKRVTFNDAPSFNFFRADAQRDVTCCWAILPSIWEILSESLWGIKNHSTRVTEHESQTYFCTDACAKTQLIQNRKDRATKLRGARTKACYWHSAPAAYNNQIFSHACEESRDAFARQRLGWNSFPARSKHYKSRKPPAVRLQMPG